MTRETDILKGEKLLDDFDRLYISYYSIIKRFVSCYSFSTEDTEDIVQGIFVTLWEKRGEITVKKNLSSYLLGLSKNRCIDYIRHEGVKNRYKEECEAKLRALELIRDYDLSDIQLEVLLRQAIEELPPRCRTVFELKRFAGKKSREIAEELNISESSVDNQMSIAMDKLREKLKDYLPVLLFFI